ncbi:S1C family serine protease [Anaerolinea thermophila]|uniref:S1B family peptidase n=1 Tax=Anaerolinea thermophila (strain DSM 14523 / JCM 11388 / NBRC 100420 / UNI-1) TaxID=926569 RepID=E8MZR3_ANATU|nr:trypsin-like peptidase domain-containing protein [Anaerolinea thermophila]BAJ64611.1 putative S1B family peptidase [Anaerolinea thermophila UNI-1]
MKHRISLFFGVIFLALVTLACRFTLPETLQPIPSPTAAAPVTVQTPAVEPPASVSVPDLVSHQDRLVALYEQVNPGVVSLQVLTETGGSQGSGFVYDREGHIITNFHVVDGATDLEVDFPSGIKVRGEVIGTDPDSDLAVVKVNVPPEELHPLPLGSGEAVKVGQTVVAIGNPFGLSSTMTLGIVSAKGRTLESLREAPQGGFFSTGGLIQTDAAINPGNSGGPLLNLNGEVIGVNRAIRTTTMTALGEPTNSGIGFAVNVDIVARVVPELIKNGKYDYPYLGVSSQEEITLMMQEALGLPRATGAYVLEVRPNSPAARAGLRAGTRSSSIPGLPAGGDLIIAVDGRPVRVFGDLLSYLMIYKRPGDTIVLTILRDNKEMEVTVTLDKRP